MTRPLAVSLLAPRRRCLCVGLLWPLTTVLCLGGDQGTRPWTAEGHDGPLYFVVAAPEQSVAGDPLLLTLTIRNTGTGRLTIPFASGSFTDFGIELAAPQGGKVSLTAFGTKEERRDLRAIQGLLIRPGDEVRFCFNLGRLLDLTIPGDYTLSVCCRANLFTSKEQVTLAGIRVRIIEPPEGRNGIVPDQPKPMPSAPPN